MRKFMFPSEGIPSSTHSFNFNNNCDRAEVPPYVVNSPARAMASEFEFLSNQPKKPAPLSTWNASYSANRERNPLSAPL